LIINWIFALIFSSSVSLYTKGFLIIAGALLTLAGIIVCAKASSIKTESLFID
jgi:hypothetical protein